MPIIGLTDRQAAFPQIGTLRKGAPKPEKGPGKDLKHFRFDADDDATRALFEETYGTEPRQVEIYLPYHTTEENFQAWKEHWVAGGLQHRCDGSTCVRWRKPGGDYSDTPQPCPGGCKQVGRLMVIIPALKRFAYVSVLTTSIHDIIELNENLLALEMMRGSLQGVPLILSRKPRQISMPSKDGGRVRVEKWLLSIEAKPAWVQIQLAAMDRQALALPGSSLPALASTRHVDISTGEIIDGDVDEDDEIEMPEQQPAASLLSRNAVKVPLVPVKPIDDPRSSGPGDFIRSLHQLAYELGIETPALEIAYDDSDPIAVAEAGKQAKRRIFEYIQSAGLSVDGLKNINTIRARAYEAKINLPMLAARVA